MRPSLSAAAAAASLLLAAGCAAGPSDADQFETEALTAVTAALSETRTVQAAVGARLDGLATTAYTRVVVDASDKALGPAADGLAGANPPPSRDGLRTRLLDEISAAQDAVADARIALSRGDTAGLQEAHKAVEDAGDALEKEEGGLQ